MNLIHMVFGQKEWNNKEVLWKICPFFALIFVNFIAINNEFDLHW